MPDEPRIQSFPREKDEEILMMLHLYENEGLTCEMIGKRFGRTKGGVIGALNRVRNDCKDDNGVGNGTMPTLWWRVK